MVSKASDDLPEPLSPVITVSVLRGISTEMFFKLCWRAPRTVMLLIAICLLNLVRGTARKPIKTKAYHYYRVPEGRHTALLRILTSPCGCGQFPSGDSEINLVTSVICGLYDQRA